MQPNASECKTHLIRDVISHSLHKGMKVKSNQSERASTTRKLLIFISCALLVGTIVQTSLSFFQGQLSMISEVSSAVIEGTDGEMR
jgi:hypothetical protein